MTPRRDHLLLTPLEELQWAIERLSRAEEAIPLRIDFHDDRVVVALGTVRSVVRMALHELTAAEKAERSERK